MNQRNPVLERMASEHLLAVVTDSDGNLICEYAASPAAGLFHSYFNLELPPEKELILYAVQAGIAMGLLASRLRIRECIAKKVSVGGLQEFQRAAVSVRYQELIPYVRSSKNPEVICPVEEYLLEHTDSDARWSFLIDKYQTHKEDGYENSCSIKKSRVN